MENNFSAIKSIQDLKNLLDSGAITQQEYDVLKRKIIFGNTPETNKPTATPLPSPAASGPLAAKVIPPYNPIEEQPVEPSASVNKTNSPPEYSASASGYQQEAYNGSADASINDGQKNPKIDFFKNYNEYQLEEQNKTKQKDWLLTVLVILSVILLLGLIGYYLFGKTDSENLTSRSSSATETATAAEKTPEPVNAPAPTNTETTTPAEPSPADRVAETSVPASEPTPVNTPAPIITPTDETPATPEAPVPEPAAKLPEDEILNKVRNRLQAYYNDIKNAPFAAQNHFASNVERYYTLLGTTPQAINDNINTYHYSEFQDSESTIEDGSLKLTGNGENGYEVTYIEHGSAFRKSKGQKQETTARVRARFDKNFKLTYFRQEQLLENKFTNE